MERSLEETARAVKPAVVGLGAAFGHDASFAEHGARLGLDRWAFYFGGRAGVLGPAGAEVVAAACGFFALDLVRRSWTAVLASGRLDEIVRTDVELCVAWARTHFGDGSDVVRAAALTSRVIEAADAAGRVLFAAWRALPDPIAGGAAAGAAADPAAVLGLNLLRLREHRGASHLLAVAAEGLTPLEAILAGPGERKAAANGWRPPYPAVAEPARLAAAEKRTDMLAGAPYAAVTVQERQELVDLLRRLGG